MVVGSTGKSVAAAGSDSDTAPLLTAYLDGKPIPLADVSRYYCDDFSYPVIRCSTSRLTIDLRAAVNSLLASVDYVTIFENTNYQGGAMNVSQDYNALAWIGWNDKISSFKARNSETGRFYTDWFYGGSTWGFCCNQTQASLGGYDNTFSSIERT